MLPEAKGDDLLYLSDNESQNVYVYSYPAGKEVGLLSGIYAPQYECADKNGNVFLTASDPYRGGVYEFAHGASEPTKILPLDLGRRMCS